MHKNILKDGSYYEAILQLRPKKQNLITFVNNQIKNRNINVAKEINKKYGIDLYLSSRKFTLQLGKLLKKKFNGELKISKTLYSRNRITSKLIYRLTVLFRLKE